MRERVWGSGLSRLAAVLLAAGIALGSVPATAEPVKVRYPEGLTHGFPALSDASGKVLAHGELTQWLEGRVLASRMVFYFDDGSIYDETMRFSQRSVFRLLSYHLVQRGPSFQPSSEYKFDRSGRYSAWQRSAPDKEEETASGTVDVPDDASNGMMSMILKNLKPGTAATTHLLAFTPKPVLLELHFTPEGSDQFWVGPTAQSAGRFLIDPDLTGVKGVLADVLGKDPPAVRMWIAQGKAPTFLRFQGPLYVDGPEWRIELGAPQWKKP